MATGTTLADAGHRLERVARYLEGDLTPMAVGIGTAAKAGALEAARAATGGSGRLSHMGRKGVTLGAGYEIGERGRRVTVRFRPPGAWIITDTGARAHAEPRLSKRGRRRRGAKGALYGAGLTHPLARVEHPGMSGRHSLTLAAHRIHDVAPRAANDALVRELGRIYG